jgi:hypothetical protein
MNEGVKFVAAMLEAEERFAELCEHFGSAENKGTSGSSSTSRVACKRWWTNHGRRTATRTLCRRKHPRWGPRKLLVVVRRQHPEAERPAASTVGTILKKYGLVGRLRRVRRSGAYKDRLGPYDAANRVWCAEQHVLVRSGTLQGQLPGRRRALQPADRQRWLQSLPAHVQGAAEHHLRAGGAVA